MNESEILKRLDVIESYAKLAAKNVLTVADVILLTGLSRSHIYNLTHQRLIPFHKPNGKVLYFKRDELEEWMLRNRQQTQEETEQEAIKHLAKMNRKK